MNGCSFPDTVSSDKVAVVLLLKAEPCPLSLLLVTVMSFHLSGFCPLVCCYRYSSLDAAADGRCRLGFHTLVSDALFSQVTFQPIYSAT